MAAGVFLVTSLVAGTSVLAAPSSVATGLSVTAGTGQVTLGFTQPDLTPTGGTPTGSDTRLGYRITVYQNNLLVGSTDACLENSGTTIESCVVAAYTTTASAPATLENGVTYTFKVIARWSDGNTEVQSDESVASGEATPYTSPEKPAAPTVSVNSSTSTSVDVTWVAPDDNGESIDLYTVTVWNKLGTSQITTNSGCTASTLTCTVANLTLGSAYTFKVKANNSAGDSLVSDASNAVTIVPGLPTSVAITTTTDGAGATTVKVTWAAPLASDEAISEYTVTATAGTTTVTKTWTTGLLESTFTADATGADLVLGTAYGVTVKAKNSGGYGLDTSSQSVTPSRMPGAPTNAAGTFSGTTATVTWVAPTSNGGDTITEYTASAFASTAMDTTGTAIGSCTSTGALTCQVTGLIAGTGYKFAVKAKNNVNGYGAFSSLTSTVTAPIVTAPGAPTSVGATFSTTTATVTWVAPGSNGGENVSEYTASAFASTATDTTGVAIGSCTSTGALTCQITGLSADTGYKFAVKAKNNTAGYGVFSSLSSPITSPATTTSTTSTTSTVAPQTITTTTIATANVTTSTISSTTTTVVSTIPPVTISSTKLSSSHGAQVSIARSPSAGVIKTVEIALSMRKVTVYLATPTSTNTKTAITKYVVELRPTKGMSIKKTITVKSGQIIKPALTGKIKTTYYVVVIAYQKSGKAITWKGPKIVTK